MTTDVTVGDAVLEHARGVLAERFGVEIATADKILQDCARAQQRTPGDLAVAVVASCTSDSSPLPRRLYALDDEPSSAA